MVRMQCRYGTRRTYQADVVDTIDSEGRIRSHFIRHGRMYVITDRDVLGPIWTELRDGERI
jgi:hypothetical protein